MPAAMLCQAISAEREISRPLCSKRVPGTREGWRTWTSSRSRNWASGCQTRQICIQITERAQFGLTTFTTTSEMVFEPQLVFAVQSAQGVQRNQVVQLAA